MELINENISLKEKIKLLENELNIVTEKLKKYTSPDRNKKYYANHKDEIKQKKENKEYNYIISNEKKKQYNKIAYLKRKEKNKEKNKEENIIK